MTPTLHSFDKQLTIAIVGLGYVGLPLAVEFGKKMVTRMMSATSCKTECSTELEEGETFADRDEEQCGHVRLTLDGVLRPELPVCQVESASLLSSAANWVTSTKLVSYCMLCQQAEEKCDMDSDCATGLCLDKKCGKINLLPGMVAKDERQCFSGMNECANGHCLCRVQKNNWRNQVRCDKGKDGKNKGGCRCDSDDICGDGKCMGGEYGSIKSTWGTCSGKPPDALCSEHSKKSRALCCDNIECSWKRHKYAPPHDPTDGTCIQATKPWPHRPRCDTKYKKKMKVKKDGSTSSLLQSNERRKL
mgnify:CR=1 FL=1